jgi:hypothetical protein
MGAESSSCKARREGGQRFFRKALKQQGRPPKTITADGYAASHRAVREMKEDGLLRPQEFRCARSMECNSVNSIRHPYF